MRYALMHYYNIYEEKLELCDVYDTLEEAEEVADVMNSNTSSYEYYYVESIK